MGAKKDWLEKYLDYTNNTESPEMFRKWCGISCIAAALQRKCYIEWGGSLFFYPNFYIVLVGPSAAGKGTAMNPALKILNEVPSIRLSSQSASLQALIAKLKDINSTDININTGKQSSHSSLTIFSKEFTVFLGYQNKELISYLCDWYDCEDYWEYETVSRGKESISGLWVNILGATTPDLIKISIPIEAIGSGFSSRIIFVFEEKRGKLIPLPLKRKTDSKVFDELVLEIEKINNLKGEFKQTDNFNSAWIKWVEFADKNPPFYDYKFDGYIGRRRMHIIKLCMIFCVSRGGYDLIIRERDLKKAVEYLTQAEIKMGLVFRGIGKSDVSSLINDAIQFFITYPIKGDIPYWHFVRKFSNDMDKDTMDRILRTLEASKFISFIKKEGELFIILIDKKTDIRF